MRNILGIGLFYLAILIAMFVVIALVQWNCGVTL